MTTHLVALVDGDGDGGGLCMENAHTTIFIARTLRYRCCYPVTLSHCLCVYVVGRVCDADLLLSSRPFDMMLVTVACDARCLFVIVVRLSQAFDQSIRED